jgi:hypothetical protein
VDGVSRRRFLGETLNVSALTALVSALPPLAAVAGGAEQSPVLFDPRFPQARKLAERLAGTALLIPTEGDPLDLLERCYALADTSAEFRLAGVTTDSVPFCLQQLAARGAAPKLTIERIDQDLFSWRLEYPR